MVLKLQHNKIHTYPNHPPNRRLDRGGITFYNTKNMKQEQDIAPAHSTHSPSSAKRWMTCTASIHATQTAREAGLIPHESQGSTEANEGTLAHDKAEAWLKHYLKGDDAPETGTQYDVTAYTGRCLEIAERNKAMRCTTHIEMRVPLFYKPRDKGTADFVHINYDQKHMTVVDLKYGVGQKVSANNNPQLLIYGISVIDHLNDDPHLWTLSTEIVQPRVEDGHSVAHYTEVEIADWRADIQRAYTESLDPKLARYDASACLFCPIADICIVKNEAAIRGVEALTQAIDENEDVLTFEEDEIALLVTQSAKVEAFLKNLKARAIAIAEETGTCGNLVLKEGRKLPRKWSKIGASAALDYYGDAVLGEPKMITPAQLAKNIGEKVDEEMLEPQAFTKKLEEI